MASIIKKKSKYSTYYVVAESARVDGKPRIVKQWYLGTIEKIIAIEPLPKVKTENMLV